jgi:hypothetical protein
LANLAPNLHKIEDIDLFELNEEADDNDASSDTDKFDAPA